MKGFQKEIRKRELPESFYLYPESWGSQGERSISSWILSKSGSNLPALTISSNSGDLSSQLSLIIGYQEGKQLVHDPAKFITPPQLHDFHTSWIEYICDPFDKISTREVIWVCDQTALCGLLEFINQSDQIREIGLQLTGRITFQGATTPLQIVNIAGRDILTGELKHWQPIIYLSGSTQVVKLPLPGLSSIVSVYPGEKTQLRWIMMPQNSPDLSIKKIDQLISLDWEGEISRKKIAAQNQLRIQTGNPDWDFALALSQKEAAAYIKQLKTSRQRESSSLNFLTPLQALHLLQAIDPITESAPLDLLQLVVPSFTDDIIPDQPLPPLIGELLWQILELQPDLNEINKILPVVEQGYQNWFSTKNDHDQDGIPELTPAWQFDLVDPRSFDSLSIHELIRFSPYLESPGLISLLCNDLKRIIDLKNRWETQSSNTGGRKQIRRLEKFINNSWNKDLLYYLNRDRDTHLSLPGRILVENTRQNFIVPRKKLDHPSRIGIVIKGDNPGFLNSKMHLFLHGKDWNKNYRIESIPNTQFQHNKSISWAVSETIFSEIEFAFVNALGKNQRLSLICPNGRRADITSLLPLWLENTDHEKARSLIDQTITNPDKFWSRYGIRSFPIPEESSVQLPWNTLIGQGILRFGERDLAADLFTRWMRSISINLTETGVFYSAYNASSGRGVGNHNSLEGLIPIRLLLQIMGFEFRSDREVEIVGAYPFSWPVTLSIRGVCIQRDRKEIRVEIPGKDRLILPGSSRACIPLV